MHHICVERRSDRCGDHPDKEKLYRSIIRNKTADHQSIKAIHRSRMVSNFHGYFFVFYPPTCSLGNMS